MERVPRAKKWRSSSQKTFSRFRLVIVCAYYFLQSHGQNVAIGHRGASAGFRLVEHVCAHDATRHAEEWSKRFALEGVRKELEGVKKAKFAPLGASAQ